MALSHIAPAAAQNKTPEAAPSGVNTGEASPLESEKRFRKRERVLQRRLPPPLLTRLPCIQTGSSRPHKSGAGNNIANAAFQGAVGTDTQSGYSKDMKTQVLSTRPDVMGGAPVFAGTRVPVQTLLDYLAAGESIDDFLEGFPTVTRAQVLAFLKDAKESLVETIS